MSFTQLLLITTAFSLVLEPARSDDQQDNLITEIAANFYEAEGPDLVYELTELGYTEHTATEMAREVAHESSRCLYIAIMEQAEAQSIDPKAYLDAFTVGLSDREAIESLRPDELGERARWCMSAARLSRGLQPPS